MSDPRKIIEELTFERLTGTAGERRAAGVICRHLRTLGLKPRLEPFPVNTFETGTATVEAGGRRFKAHPFGLTRSLDISGELVFVEDPEVILRNRGAYQGQVLLIYNYTRRISPALREQRVKACLVIGPPYKQAPSWSYRQKDFALGYVPSATVDYRDGVALKAMSGNRVRLKVTQKVRKGTGHNIIVDIKGKGRDETLTLACGHYDSVARSPGATDNAGGVAVLLKVAEHFSKNKPARDLRIIFFSGEELGLRGSFAYVTRHKAEIKKRLGLVVNVDVAGDELGRNQLLVIGTQRLLGYAEGIVREQGYFFHPGLDIYSSDNMPFSALEVPSVNIVRSGGRSSFLGHTPGDDISGISSSGLAPSVAAAIGILERVLNAGIYPVDREIDPLLRPKIEKYLWGSKLETPQLDWQPEYQK